MTYYYKPIIKYYYNIITYYYIIIYMYICMEHNIFQKAELLTEILYVGCDILFQGRMPTSPRPN